jgi:hypothetical protein
VRAHYANPKPFIDPGNVDLGQRPLNVNIGSSLPHVEHKIETRCEAVVPSIVLISLCGCPNSDSTADALNQVRDVRDDGERINGIQLLSRN